MTPFTVVEGLAVALLLDNVDTDQLIPARFMQRSRSDGYGDYLFYDQRVDQQGKRRPEFALNAVAEPPVLLLAGKNFGCGSSREAAVYALMDYGIRVVVARSFADIFRNNAVNNGLLTVVLTEDNYHLLASYLSVPSGVQVSVNLKQQKITVDGHSPLAFDVEPEVKRKLLLGLDMLTETLSEIDAISVFEKRYFETYSWVKPVSHTS